MPVRSKAFRRGGRKLCSRNNTRSVGRQGISQPVGSAARAATSPARPHDKRVKTGGTRSSEVTRPIHRTACGTAPWTGSTTGRLQWHLLRGCGRRSPLTGADLSLLSVSSTSRAEQCEPIAMMNAAVNTSIIPMRVRRTPSSMAAAPPARSPSCGSRNASCHPPGPTGRRDPPPGDSVKPRSGSGSVRPVPSVWSGCCWSGARSQPRSVVGSRSRRGACDG